MEVFDEDPELGHVGGLITLRRPLSLVMLKEARSGTLRHNRMLKSSFLNYGLARREDSL